jgi:hypothetical protein
LSLFYIPFERLGEYIAPAKREKKLNMKI